VSTYSKNGEKIEGKILVKLTGKCGLVVTKKDGIWNVKITKGGIINMLGDMAKSLVNGEIYSANSKMLALGHNESELENLSDFSGMYEKNDSRFKDWRDEAMEEMKFDSGDDWNIKAAEWRDKYSNDME
jgi:hypothetical protein